MGEVVSDLLVQFGQALSTRPDIIPGILLEDLPPIDIIVISHNHYDHLDKKTLDQIPKKEIK